MPLGRSGWTASWSSENDATLSLSVDFEDRSHVFIEKLAIFNDLKPKEILFTQTRPDAVGMIVINDEIVINQSSSAWSGFSMELKALPASPKTPTFDVQRSAAFDIKPFSLASYSQTGQTLDLLGGSGVANQGALWMAGLPTGSLWINAAPASGAPQSFKLVETPSPIPEPATALPLVIGSAMWLVRRSRRA